MGTVPILGDRGWKKRGRITHNLSEGEKALRLPVMEEARLFAELVDRDPGERARLAEALGLDTASQVELLRLLEADGEGDEDWRGAASPPCRRGTAGLSGRG